MIVVDASVLTEVLLDREQALVALERALAGREHEPVHVPEVIETETLNFLRMLTLRRRVTVWRATKAVVDLANSGWVATRTGC